MSTAALLNRPDDRWQFWASFAGAILIHLAAVGIAGIAPVTEAETITISTGFHDVVLADISEPDATELTATPVVEPATTPIPEEDPADAAEPTTPIAESEVPEEQATPPPIRRTTSRKPPQRLIRVTSATPGATSVAKSARSLAISAPRPEYPREALRNHVSGSGVAMLTVDFAGRVVRVSMVQSTGSGVLDNATISGLKRWRFRPGTASKLQTPVTFMLTGSSL